MGPVELVWDGAEPSGANENRATPELVQSSMVWEKVAWAHPNTRDLI